MKGINELVKVMNITEESLAAVKIPTLIIQSSKDPIVNPESGRQIFEQISTPHKELIMVERSRHGVINGEGRDDVFSHIHHFLSRAPVHGIVVQGEGASAEQVG